jgi:hypothetical protein
MYMNPYGFRVRWASKPGCIGVRWQIMGLLPAKGLKSSSGDALITKGEAVVTVVVSSMARFGMQGMMLFVYNQASASVSTFSSRKSS